MKSLEIILKNLSQVFLIENIWTGLCFLIALFVANVYVGSAALAASILSLLVAAYFGYTEEEISHGLAGFNPILTAIALTLFLDKNWHSVILIIAAVFITLVMNQVLSQVMKTFGLPVFTMPFIVTTWLILAMVYQTSFTNSSINILPEHPALPANSNASFDIIHAFFDSFSEVFLVTSLLAGIIILIGIAIESRKFALLSIIGTIFGVLIIFFLGGNTVQLNDGLLGYNIVLTILALLTFVKNQDKQHLYTTIIIGVILTIILDAALLTIFELFGLPVLTLPFVLASWGMLLYDAHFLSRRVTD